MTQTGAALAIGTLLSLAVGCAKLSPVVYGPGTSLVNFVSAGGTVWASDIGHTLYQVDVKTGALRPSLTLDPPDAPNQLLAAFGSIWVLGGATGRLTRIDLT